MSDEKLDINLIQKHLSVENAIETISLVEGDDALASGSDFVKWKDYFNQVVVEAKEHFYKIYEEDLTGHGVFDSSVRQCLAKVYAEMGIEWNIASFVRDGKIFDFEQREKLRVASEGDGPFEKILLSFSYVLDKVESMLEFESICGQLQVDPAFADVANLKLTRYCFNKYADFAIVNGHAVILDDADWHIALADAKGEPIIVAPGPEVPVSTSYGEFVFTSRMSWEADVPQHNSVSHAWYLIPKIDESNLYHCDDVAIQKSSEVHIRQNKVSKQVHKMSLLSGVSQDEKEQFTISFPKKTDVVSDIDLSAPLSRENFEFLEGLIEQAKSDVWISSFVDVANFRTWELNMQALNAYFPEIKKVTKIALTQEFCETFVAEGFDVPDFCGRHQTSVIFVSPTMSSALHQGSSPRTLDFDYNGCMANDLDSFSEDDLLYSNNLIRKSFQWELWQSCNNFCKFCCFGDAIKHTSRGRQLQSLKELKESLSCLDFKKYNGVSLFGGEFFAGQLDDVDIRNAFFEIIHILAELYVSKKIGYIWITANLLTGEQRDLYEVLDIFDEAGVRPHPNYGASGLWICTSWDAEGRFLTEKRKRNWEFHMNKIHKNYPWVKLNTSIILSQAFCELYLNDEFDPTDFMKKYNTSLAYNCPRIFKLTDDDKGLGSGGLDVALTQRKQDIETWMGMRFYPDRRTMRKFFLKYAKQNAHTYEKLFDVSLTADEVHRNFNDAGESEVFVADKTTDWEACTTIDGTKNPHCLCGHSIRYATYSDCNDCMICDRNQVWESLSPS